MTDSILIVEDDADIRESLYDLLSMQGYRVFVASDGAQGLTAALANKPNLIISDVMMPGLDGFQMGEFLQQHIVLRDTPIIFLTARSQVDDFRTGLRLGAVDYIPKPFRTAELLDSVRKQFERLHHQQQAQDQALYAVFENPLTAFFFFSQNRFEAINPRMGQLTGYSLAELNQLSLDKWLIGNAQAVHEQLQECLQGQRQQVKLRTLLRPKGQNPVEVDLYARFLQRGTRPVLLGQLIATSAEAPNEAANSSVGQILDYLRQTQQHQLADELAAAERIVGFEQDRLEESLHERIGLSQREKEVLGLICEGLTNTEIAQKLFLSARTVDNHRANLLAKTGTRNTAQLVAFSIMHHLL